MICNDGKSCGFSIAQIIHETVSHKQKTEMKIQKLIVENFRGLKGNQNIIDFDNSNIIFLIGQNNVGKSSFLKAYEFFINPSKKALREDFHNYNTENPIIITGEFLKEEVDEEDANLNAEPDWINRWVDENSKVKVRKTWDTINQKFTKQTFDPETNEWVSNGFGGLHQKLTKYTPEPIVISAMENESSLEDKVNKLIQDDFIKKVKEDYPEQYQTIINQITDLQQRITGNETVEGFNQDLNTNFQKVFANLTLKIEPKEETNLKVEDAFKKNHSISVQREGIERRETFIQNGHGVIRQVLFNFLTFLKRNSETLRKEYIILFEEPELYLHPKVAFNLRKTLYDLADNSPYEILCATHSPLMIDISKPHSSLVRITKDNNEETKTFQIGHNVFHRDEERKHRVQMINRFNPHICESFYSDKVLLVEGDTETIVYRDILNRLFPEEEIFVLNTGSKNNIPFFQEILTNFNIEHYVIHDTDTRLNANGNQNSAWTLNQRISEKIDLANEQSENLARRYVHVTNFETAHNINLTGKDKPIKAYEFVSNLTMDSDASCLNWLKDIIGNKEILHNQEFIENTEPI